MDKKNLTLQFRKEEAGVVSQIHFYQPVSQTQDDALARIPLAAARHASMTRGSIIKSSGNIFSTMLSPSLWFVFREFAQMKQIPKI